MQAKNRSRNLLGPVNVPPRNDTIVDFRLGDEYKIYNKKIDILTFSIPQS